jgi:hypothetical protein
VSGHRVLMHVDDLLCRGSRADSEYFYSRLAERFDCKDADLLDAEHSIMYTGIEISMKHTDEGDVYSMSQQRDLESMLVSQGLSDCKFHDSPMPDRKLMLSDDTPVTDSEQRWCRSVIGELWYIVRGTRWDIAHAVSRVSQHCANPTAGTVKALRHLAGYLIATKSLCLTGRRVQGADSFTVAVDSDHHGDPNLLKQSQSGLIVLLNGVPVMWRSNVQPRTSISPAMAEVYALSEGARDARYLGWVGEEMGLGVTWPMVLQVDSEAARSFQGDTCPKSKLRGCFDLREKWVEELRSWDQISTVHVQGTENMADMFTKCLKTGDFIRARKRVLDYQCQYFFEGN